MASAPVDLHGLWVPVITPLGRGGHVDTGALGRLARRLLGDGCTGLVALGTTGEPATLTADERRRVVETCAEACADVGRPLVVGAGSNATGASIDEAAAVSALVHPAALLVVVPYYTRPSEPWVVEHFLAMATALPTPLIVYNIPHRTGRGLGAEAILELADHPGIVGLKQSVGALDRDTLEILRRRPERFHVLAGDDAYIVPTVLMGGAGAIAAAAHLCTPRFVAMVRAALDGDVTAAVAASAALLPVVEAGSAEPSPAVWKAALHAGGEIPTAALRPPMGAASPASTAALLDAVAAARAVPPPSGRIPVR